MMIKEALIKKLEGDVAVAETDLRTFLAPLAKPLTPFLTLLTSLPRTYPCLGATSIIPPWFRNCLGSCILDIAII